MCQLRLLAGKDSEEEDVIDRAISEKVCADSNLLASLHELSLRPERVLMVGATADEVGFVDSLDDYDKLTGNPNGWRELPGYNAFFGRENEIDAIGCRMADCADINFEFKDRDGNTVFGFEHGTRTNMFGRSRYEFEKDGRKMSYTEYVIRHAVDHYGADPSTIRINLASAIRGQNNEWHFDDPEKIERYLPGWQADGFLLNVDNPDWRPGDAVAESDTWQADTQGMIIRDIEEAMHNLGIPAENLDKSDILDPNDSNGMHSSHKASYLSGSTDTRDLYIVYSKNHA
jgi:hypothetical protein